MMLFTLTPIHFYSALGRTPRQLYLPRLPVNFWIVTKQPSVSNDSILVSQVTDSKSCLLSVVLVCHENINLFFDGTPLIQGTISIIHRYSSRQLPGIEVVPFNKRSGKEKTSCT